MYFRFFYAIFFIVVINYAISCSTKNDYHYNVVDCKEPQIQALGEYILAKLKSQRDLRTTTCDNSNMDFLRVAPFESKDKKFDAQKLAASWVYKNANSPQDVFTGPIKTLEALGNETTWNIIVDKKLTIHRYVLRNSTNGAITIQYLTEQELMSRVSYEQYWDHLDVLSCDNFLFHLSKEHSNQLVSFTVVDKANSNDELRFILKSGGIGGFYKTTAE